MHASLSLPVHWLDECAIVGMPATIDLTTAPTVTDGLRDVLHRGARGVIVDMSGTDFCGASGVNAVVRAYNCAETLGAWVRLVIPQRQVRKVFAVTSVDRLVRVYPTLDDALPERGGPR